MDVGRARTMQETKENAACIWRQAIFTFGAGLIGVVVCERR